MLTWTKYAKASNLPTKLDLFKAISYYDVGCSILFDVLNVNMLNVCFFLFIFTAKIVMTCLFGHLVEFKFVHSGC